MVGYYRELINGIPDIARPIARVIRRDAKCEWSKDNQMGFEYIKNYLTKDPIFKYPDPSKRYVFFTDVYNQTVVAVLTQEYPDSDG